MSTDLMNVVARWNEAKLALKEAQEAERELRAMAVSLAFPGIAPDAEGAKRVPLGNDKELKVTFKLNYKLDPDAADDALTAMEKAGEEGKFLAERLVKWKPELSISEYRKLPGNFAAMIEKALTVTPATPTVEIVDKSAK